MSNEDKVKHLDVKVAERELEELRVVGQALNSEVKQLELFLASVSIHLNNQYHDTVYTLLQLRLILGFKPIMFKTTHFSHLHICRWSRWRRG